MRMTRRILGAGISVAGGMTLFNFIEGQRAGELASELPGRTNYWASPYGRVFYKTLGAGEPVTLLHGFNAAASSYEMRQQVDPLSQRFRVIAPDWLGFGLSDRPALVYTADMYIDLLEGFLRQAVGEPTHVVASSLAGAYVIALAARAPQLFRRLVLVAPTGLVSLADRPDEFQGGLRRLVVSPLLGTTLFNALVTRPSLRYFLGQQGYADPAHITDAIVDAHYAAAHQPGARHAPASFISGHLNLSVRRTWPQISQPALLVWGKNATSTPVGDAQAFLALRPEVRLEVFDQARLLPHDEHAARFNALVMEFLSHGH